MLGGIIYNFRGLWLGIRTPRLLVLGLLRFLVMVLLAFLIAGFVLAYHGDLSGMIWTRPENLWLKWLWHLFSWLLTLLLVAASSLLSYLAGQILFGAVIMDVMSRTTERIVTGAVTQPTNVPISRQFLYLIGQEIPRSILPIFLSIMLMIFGWLTPLGPVIALLSTMASAVFLAWDNTDIIPARQFVPFRDRMRFLKANLFFHLGFGLCFLVPFANILFLSFAPVGATLHHIDQRVKKGNPGAFSRREATV